MQAPKKFTDLLDKVIQDGHKLLETVQINDHINDPKGLRRWSNELILLQKLGYGLIAPWSDRISHNGVIIASRSVQLPLAALETIKYAIEEGLLTSYKDLILAEEFSNLFEHACHLQTQGYYLAAAVVFRAVLEEKLRELCLSNECMPERNNPTINDYNQALYKNPKSMYDKVTMLHVTALAAIGNKAAHNEGQIGQEEIERLNTGTLEFLSKYSSAA